MLAMNYPCLPAPADQLGCISHTLAALSPGCLHIRSSLCLLSSVKDFSSFKPELKSLLLTARFLPALVFPHWCYLCARDSSIYNYVIYVVWCCAVSEAQSRCSVFVFLSFI